MNENIYEVIKAFAYGHDADTVSAVMGISVEDAKLYEKNYASEIKEEKEALRKAGYLE